MGGTELAPDAQRPGLERDGLGRCRQRLLDPGTEAGLADRLGLRRTAPSPTSPRSPGRPGLAVYDTYGKPGWISVLGGTSLASPLVGAVYALAYPDYTQATTYTHAASLFDITSGSTGSCGGSYLCTARGRLRRPHRARHTVWHRRLRVRAQRHHLPPDSRRSRQVTAHPAHPTRGH